MEITFCVPTYNRKDLLDRAIKSIINLPFEKRIIISDNASSDSTKDYCVSLVNDFDYITYYRQSENIGFVNNTLFVIDKCVTEKVVILADDDYLLESAFAEFYNFAVSLNSEIVCAKANRIDSSGQIRNTLPVKSYLNKYYCEDEATQLIMSDILMWTSVIFGTEALKESIKSLQLTTDDCRYRLAIDVAILYYFAKKYGLHSYNNAVMVFYDHNDQTSKPKNEDFFIRLYLSRVSCYDIISNGDSNHHKSIYLVNLVLKSRLQNFKAAQIVFLQYLNVSSLTLFYYLKLRFIQHFPLLFLKIYYRIQLFIVWVKLRLQVFTNLQK